MSFLYVQITVSRRDVLPNNYFIHLNSLLSPGSTAIFHLLPPLNEKGGGNKFIFLIFTFMCGKAILLLKIPICLDGSLFN